MPGSAHPRGSRRLLLRTAARLTAGCLGALALAGCAVGPDFRPPRLSTPRGWTAAPAPPPLTPVQHRELTRWWANFRDPVLDSLVDRAVKSNLDLQAAEARVEQARAGRGVAASALWPSVTATASGQGSSTHTTVHGGTKAGAGPQSGTVHQRLAQAALSATWLLDVFGGTRRNVEAAEADLESAIEDRRDVLVTLLSEVAFSYIDLRGFQQQSLIAEKNLAAQRQNVDLTRKRRAAGIANALDVANAEAQAASTAATLPPLDAGRRQATYALSVLLGLPPADLVAELTPTAGIPAVAAPEVPLGLPSDLLRRRPDLRRAEAQLHAATARIGVAIAELFPTFNLNAAGSFESLKTTGVPRTTTRTGSGGLASAWELFTGGRISSNIQAAKAVEREALLAYRKAVLTALQDVENALIAYAKEREHHKALTESVAANRKALDVATQLYTLGQTDFLNVIVAQGSLYLAETALVLSTHAISADLVALYRALGGGWAESPLPAPAPAPGPPPPPPAKRPAPLGRPPELPPAEERAEAWGAAPGAPPEAKGGPHAALWAWTPKDAGLPPARPTPQAERW